MKLLKLQMHNFMPYRGTHEISFPTDQQHNVMLLFGDNMRGKTSFLNSIRWCFFGCALGRNLKVIDPFDILNSRARLANDFSTWVRLQFVADSDEFELRRNMGPKPLVHLPKRTADLDTTVMMRKNGNVLRGEQIPHEINQIIPEDIQRFFLFDGELLQEYEVLLENKNEQGEKIKESIEQILGVPALIRARTHLAHHTKEARKRHAKDSEQIESVKKQSVEMAKLVNHQELIEADITRLRESEESYRSQRDILDSEIETARDAYEASERMGVKKKSLKEKGGIEEKLRSEKLILLKESWRDAIQPTLSNHVEHLESQLEELRNTERQVVALEGKLEALTALCSESQCPTCGESISDSRHPQFVEKLQDLQEAVELERKNRKDSTDLTARISRLKRIKATDARYRLPKLDKELQKVGIEATELMNEIEELESELEGHDTADIVIKRSKRDKILEELGILRRDIDDAKKKLDANLKDQDTISSYIESDAEAREQKSYKKKVTFEQLGKVFGAGISKLRDSLRAEVESLASETFRSLTTEKTYQGLRINSNYGLTIIDENGDEVVERSAGAEQIVALSLIDGLNKTARKSGPIVMDTPLGRLDLKHRSHVLDYLPQMAEQVILLVHEGEIRRSEILESLKERIGMSYTITRISSAESEFTRGLDDNE